MKIGSVVFFVLYQITGMTFGLLAVFLKPLPFRMRYEIIMEWNRVVMWLLRLCCDIRYDLRGMEQLPQAPFVVMAKHQSTWETLFLQITFKPLSTVLKQELLRIPFFGWGLSVLEPIAIDRSNPKRALRKIMEVGVSYLKRGKNVLIFPEGTRTPPGQKGKYARSGAQLALKAGVPIVPVAHNAGNYWSEGLFNKTPGTIQVVVGQPISTEGRSAKELTQEVESWIESQISQMDSIPASSE